LKRQEAITVLFALSSSQHGKLKTISNQMADEAIQTLEDFTLKFSNII
jgi:hypothetical protein